MQLEAKINTSIPCPPSATSQEAAFVPAGELVCRAPGTQTCLAGPGPTGYQSTAARERSGLAEWERSESDELCLVCAGYPEKWIKQIKGNIGQDKRIKSTLPLTQPGTQKIKQNCVKLPQNVERSWNRSTALSSELWRVVAPKAPCSDEEASQKLLPALLRHRCTVNSPNRRYRWTVSKKRANLQVKMQV